LNVDRYARYLYEAGTCDIDVDRLLQRWLNQIKQCGAEVAFNSEIKAIERSGTLWTVSTSSGDWQARTLINASGAWADNIASLAGVKPLGLRPLRRSAAIVELADSPALGNWPLFAEIDESWYAKPEAGQLLVSPAEEDPLEASDAWVDDEVLAGGIDRFEQGVTSIVSRVHHQWAGLRTFASDKTPVVGFDRDVDDFFWLAGHGGYGIQTAPALSQIAATLVLGQAGNPALSEQLSPSRF